MGITKEISIKNRTYYYYNDIIDLDEFDENKIKVDKKDFNDIDIYYLGYEYKKKITECNIINNKCNINIPTATIVIRAIFAKDDKYYPQLFLDDGLYKKCYRMKESIFQMESMLMSQINKKNVCSVIIGIF